MLRKRKRRVWLILLAVLGGYLGVCFFLARNYIAPKRMVAEVPFGLEEVSIPTKEGPDPSFVTPGLAKGKASGTVVVFAHGYGGNRLDWWRPMRELEKHGIESIAPSMNGQDASPDPTVGFGTKESHTIVSAVRWAREHSEPGTKVIVFGLSMGGASAWLASELDPSIDGIITDGAYARLDEASDHFFNRACPGGSFFLRPVIWMATGMSGIQPSSVVPMDAAAKWKGRPSLVIQGSDDRLILRPHADRLASCAGCDLWLVPKARHAECYDAAPEEYVGRILAMARRLP